MESLLKNLISASQMSTPPPYLEVRADTITDFSLSKLLQNKINPTIFTCYSRINGGCFRGTEKERLGLLSSAIRSGRFEYVTIDIPVSFPPVPRGMVATKAGLPVPTPIKSGRGRGAS
ncbi:MAG: type I 3-dehydroquinate dehydratase, partial [Planctomycetota bacterium]|nr:type I 3-dehydroquinate dehydratase [Planctomycetota bacterium]